MQAFKQLSKTTQTLLIAGLILFLYGFLCRRAGIYFFWESRAIGVGLLMGGVIGILLYRIKFKKAKDKRAIPEKIGAGILAFGLLLQTLFAVGIRFSEAYSAAEKYVKTNPELRSEIGNISGMGFIPAGGLEMSSDSSGQHGHAEINTTLKGDKSYKDVRIYIVKNADSAQWIVEGIQ